jgi:adenine-specific DNA glycosylase
LHRTFVGPEHEDGTWEKDDRYLLKIAEEVLEQAVQKSPHDTANWHAALMDFGSLVCTKRNPRWNICPLTAKDLMKTTPKMWQALESEKPKTKNQKPKTSSEPGRLVGSVHIPNRIFRGRIVEQLRDEHQGLTLKEIGKRISVDWDPDEHTAWLKGLLEKLEKDGMIAQKHQVYMLSP